MVFGGIALSSEHPIILMSLSLATDAVGKRFLIDGPKPWFQSYMRVTICPGAHSPPKNKGSPRGTDGPLLAAQSSAFALSLRCNRLSRTYKYRGRRLKNDATEQKTFNV
jgi:hypothetical protein